MIKTLPPWLKDWLRPVKRAGLCLRGLDFFCRLDVRLKLEHHGSAYGGWSVVENSLGPEAVVFSFGLGHDLSFDESIINKYGCGVIGYDPDPRAWNYHVGRQLPARLQWIRKGIGSSDSTVTFYPPKRDDYISGTIVANRPGHSADGFEIELVDVASVTAEAAAKGRIDVLKMDIEGAEYGVIRRLIETGRMAKIGFFRFLCG